MKYLIYVLAVAALTACGSGDDCYGASVVNYNSNPPTVVSKCADFDTKPSKE